MICNAMLVQDIIYRMEQLTSRSEACAEWEIEEMIPRKKRSHFNRHCVCVRIYMYMKACYSYEMVQECSEDLYLSSWKDSDIQLCSAEPFSSSMPCSTYIVMFVHLQPTKES